MAKPSSIQTVNANRAFWTAMIYAEPGVGKTYFAGTSARANHDTLIIRPPTDHTDTLAIHFDHEIDEWVVRDWHDLDEVHEYLRHEAHGYRWVWADSMSLLQEVGLDGIMTDLIAAKPHRNEYVPDKGEYGENMTRVRKWTSGMVGLDFNFGMTAHVVRYTSPKTGDEMLMPWIQGKMMPEKISAYANIVGHLTVIESEKHGDVRALYTKPHDEYYAKDGFGALPDRILNPQIPKMEELVAAAKAKKTTKKGAKPPAKKATRKRTAAKKQEQEEEDFTF